jgi:hypothetical protein
VCAQQRLKSRAPLHERLLTEIASVQFKKIEAIDARRRMSPVEQRKKVGRRRDDLKVVIAKDDTRVSCDAHETPAQPLSGYPLDIDVAPVYAEFDTLLSSALRRLSWPTRRELPTGIWFLRQ